VRHCLKYLIGSEEHVNIKPLKKKILVAEVKTEQKTDSGIILDQTTSLRESKVGSVLAIGPQVTLVEVGDRILLDWSKAAMVKVGDAQRVMVNEDDVVAVLEQ